MLSSQGLRYVQRKALSIEAFSESMIGMILTLLSLIHSQAVVMQSKHLRCCQSTPLMICENAVWLKENASGPGSSNRFHTVFFKLKKMSTW